MTWDKLGKKPPVPVKPTEFWRPASALRHEQGLKILAWGEAEVGKGRYRKRGVLLVSVLLAVAVLSRSVAIPANLLRPLRTRACLRS